MSGPAVLDFQHYPEAGPALGPVIDHVRSGGVIVYPTETVYGLGGLASGPALERLAAAKGRGPERPFVLLVPSRESVADLAWSPAAVELAEVFWPGAVTLVLRDEANRFPWGVRSSEGTVAVRMSPHPLAGALMEALGEPLISTSANVPGQPPALSAGEALVAVEAMALGTDTWVLDGGRLEPSAPSTMVDCSGESPVVIREGSVPLGRVRCVLPALEAMPPEGAGP